VQRLLHGAEEAAHPKLPLRPPHLRRLPRQSGGQVSHLPAEAQEEGRQQPRRRPLRQGRAQVQVHSLRREGIVGTITRA